MDGINKFLEFVAIHKPQLEATAIPQHLWQSLYHKLKMETFDASEAFQLLLIDYDDDDADVDNLGYLKELRPVFMLEVCRENGIKADDKNAIFLIDHAVTYRTSSLRQLLEQYEHLTTRMCAITNVDPEDEQHISKVMERMWKYCQTYTISNDRGTDEERTPIWYIMDEVGSAVNHCEHPNFRIVPFLYQTTQITYSLLFPIKDVLVGEPVTRDFLEYVAKDAPERPALLLPWVYEDFRNVDFKQIEPDVEYFLSGHLPESYPNDDCPNPQINRNNPLKVYAEYDVVRRFLNADCFTLVDNELEADVLWLTRHFKNFAELARETPNKFINQFPYEYVITIKDLLSITCRRSGEEHHNADSLDTYPIWLPTTYNLKTEVVQFTAYYQQRASKNLDNHWIIKPWNLARGLDTHITNNIGQIMRLPSTGPKIAQKYIERPVLFYRPELDAKVKFDVRYVILLKSVHPLEAYIHRKFFLRFSNSAFSLDHFDNYEKHFTVMNYNSAELHHIKCEDFVHLWHEQYLKNNWDNIEEEICHMLHEMLVCATKISPPRGIAACPQSRALYAADIMLEWTDAKCIKMQPKLLEVNWTPDCQRACDYYPDFFNNVFKLLFMDEVNNECFRLLGNS